MLSFKLYCFTDSPDSATIRLAPILFYNLRCQYCPDFRLSRFDRGRLLRRVLLHLWQGRSAFFKLAGRVCGRGMYTYPFPSAEGEI